MNKLTNEKRMTSIARRMNGSATWRMVSFALAVNLTLLVLCVGFFCYYYEKPLMGDSWRLNMTREVSWPEKGTFLHKASNVVYTYYPDPYPPISVDVGFMIPTALWFLGALTWVEALLIFIKHQQGRRAMRRLLEPLRRMAETTEELSRVRFDERKYHDLEDAIRAISPSKPDARVSIGDQDLLGLETAVNNLLTRMHEGYRQQAQFVSDASHELRTPISVIQGYADMLARWGKQDTKVLDESIVAIQQESKHMQTLVEQLLFLARGDAGKTQMTLHEIDLNELMDEVYDEYCMIDSSHRWKLTPGEAVPAVADIALLKQAVRILCDNAMKYSPEGSVISLKASVDDDGVPALTVQDNGEGIAAEDIPKMFDRFYRADKVRTKGGTGLGLSIAKWIVDSHHGYFQVYSRKNMGTRITICLPGKSARAKAAAAGPEGKKAEGPPRIRA